jgi:hypothetical protein
MLMAALFVSTFPPHVVASDSNKPVIPNTFDKQTVSDMIAKPDVAHNAAILRSVYFGTRSVKAFPVADGYAMLVAACNKQVVGSHEWFVLMNVRAYAAFRISPDLANEGYDAYHLIFTNTSAAVHSNAVSLAERSMYDFTYTMTTMFGPLHQAGPDEAKQVMLDAIGQQLTMIKDKQHLKLWTDWSAGIRMTGSSVAAYAITQEALNDHAYPRCYELYRIAASASEPVDTAMAAKLYREAEPLAPKDDEVALHVLYGDEVAFLVSSGMQSEAVEAQKRAVEATGSGLGSLALMYLKEKDDADYKSIVSQLCANPHPGADAIELAQGLLRYAKRDSSGHEGSQALDAIHILTSLAKLDQTAVDNDGLEARIIVSSYYIRQKDYQDAKPFLTNVAQLNPDDADSTSLLAEIDRLRQQVGNPVISK